MASSDYENDPTGTALDPVLMGKTSEPSPEERKAAEDENNKEIGKRLAMATAAGPSVRQATQSEIIDLQLIQRHLGNPFSTQWIPFEQLREMTTDLMLAFGWWSTISPIVRAEWSIDCPDAQLAAAVDEALRPCVTQDLIAMSNALWYGHQPLVKRFQLGQLGGTYRDPQADDPTKDLPVWNTSADALLWGEMSVLNPSHCLPTWDDDGQMIGFKFNSVPVPHFDLITAANMYGYSAIPGKLIDSDRAIWVVNEKELNFGNVFGSARTKRAYPYWWSYWFRWRLADRSYENLADPPKLIYYPVDFDTYMDQDDIAGATRRARQTALDLGAQTRSGATLAVPGAMATDETGNTLGVRKWSIEYLEAQNNFKDFDQTFNRLDIMKLRAWFTPEQSIIEGSGSRTSGGSAGGTGGARMASQLADVHEESQQILVEQYDRIFTEYKIKQFIAANFPEKVGIPCRKVSRALGAVDDETLSQILTLVGQQRGETLPVDIRTMLARKGIPLLNEKQFEKEIKQIADMNKATQPAVQPPTKVGTQGYNAGVMKTSKGNQYYEPPQRIVLSDDEPFMNNLPDTPHFQDVSVRSSVRRLRTAFFNRYKEQYASFADFLEQQPTLALAEDQSQQQQGLDQRRAAEVAASIIALWAASKAPGAVGHPAVATLEGFAATANGLIAKIALDGGRSSLKGVRLSAEGFDAGTLEPWSQERTSFAVNSVDNTVRSELNDWLIDELQTTSDPKVVAAAAREHFVGFPNSHADRAARTEATEAFNQGVAQAFHLAGVAQLMLHDASDGKDTTTDPACLKRNGKIVTPEQAMSEHLNHPHCTFYATALATENLTIQLVDELPMNLGEYEHPWVYDGETETFYFTDEVDEGKEQVLVRLLGQELRLQ